MRRDAPIPNPLRGTDLVELRHRAGQGNWEAFDALDLSLDAVRAAAAGWARALAGIDRPWLCWNVDSEWCAEQQALVERAGWTPVVGFDPRVGAPSRLSPNAVVVDFNDGLGFPVLYPHFPLEFAFLFADRLAFWHSDLLARPAVMDALAARFAALPDGATAATSSSPGLRHAFSNRRKRYWELVGCTTRAASADQFATGSGWWMGFAWHPNCPSQRERRIRLGYYWDHGAGIYHWERRLGGHVDVVPERLVAEGHFTKIGKADYQRSTVGDSDAQRDMRAELAANFDLATARRALGLD